MSLIIGGIGGSVGGLPDGYEYKVGTGGELELWKGEEKIATQNTDGSWFKTAVSTGVGSLHLGGGDSSDPAHSISSAGQNVVFKNESFNATAGSAVVWFPAGWQGLSADLNTVNTPTYLQFGAIDSSFQPNGNSTTGGVFYNFSTTITSNIVISQVQVQLDEGYTGKLRNVIKSQTKGVELHSSTVTVNNALAGSVITIPYPSLYFARSGDALTLQIIKDDGSFLRCRRGTTNTSLPWRRLTVRPFSDMLVGNVHIGDIKEFYGTSDHNGWVLMDGRNVNTMTTTQRTAAATIGLTSVLPDARNRFSVGAGSSYGRGVNGGDLQIKRSALPNVGITGKTNGGTAHRHGAGNITTAPNTGNHDHFYDKMGVRGASGTDFNVGNGSYYQTTTSGPGSHSHTMIGETADESAHTHTFTTDSMNGGVTQTDHLPPYIAFGKFIYLGL